MDLNLVIVFLLAAVIAVPISKWLGLGAIVGFLIAGAALGPQALGAVKDSEAILHVAEFGVVLLLFIIGLEINLNRLWTMRHGVFVLGGAQVVLSGLALTAVVYAFGFGWPASVIIGFVLALSATAFVLQMLAETAELSSRHGRTGFTILLFQDLMVVPLLVIIPLFANSGESISLGNSLWAVAKAAAIVAAVIFVGRYLLRHALRLVAKTDMREIFTAASLLLVVGTATLMEAAGLSAALGAFLAGVLTADSEYRHQLETDIEPFKGILLGLFFIAVGMSLDLRVAFESPLPIMGMVIAVLGVKGAILYAMARVEGFGHRVALRLAAALPQAGEFAFVLFGLAVTEGVLEKADTDFLYTVVVITMAVTPLIYSTVCRFTKEPDEDREPEIDDALPDRHPKVIIAGFGRVGQIVARVLAASDISFTALDRSADRVEVARQYGAEVYYGDTRRVDLLENANVKEAKVFVVAVSDVENSLTIVRMLQEEWPHLTIVARANDRFHAYNLMDLGIKHIIRETFSASLEIAEAVLNSMDYGSREAEEIVEAFRAHDENFLKREYELHRDEDALKVDIRRRNQELERLFRADRRDIEERHRDDDEAGEAAQG